MSGNREILVFGPFRLDHDARVLERDGKEVPLPPKALDLLECLLEMPEKTISKDELFERIWQDTAVTEHSLTETVRILRKALDDDPRAPQYIRTVQGRGYRFIGSVNAHDDDPAPRAAPEDHSNGPDKLTPLAGSTPRSWQPFLWSLGGGVVGALAVAALMSSSTAGELGTDPVVRSTIELGEFGVQNLQYPALALSRDGEKLVFAGCVDEPEPRSCALYLRRLDGQRIEKIYEGTVMAPFFSPDGERVGFWSRGAWTTLSLGPDASRINLVAGGQLAAGAAEITNASWGDDDTIIFATRSIGGGLWRIPAAGGDPNLVVANQSNGPEFTWTEMLPGAKNALVVMASPGSRDVAVVDLETGDHRVIVRNARSPRYVDSGHLLFVRDDGLFAVRFATEELEIIGAPVRLPDEPQSVAGVSQLAVSAAGTLVFGPPTPFRVRSMQLIDRGGRKERVETTRGSDLIADARVSPDGSSYVLALVGGEGRDLWRLSAHQPATASRLTSGEWNRDPLFSRDGSALVFSSRVNGKYELGWMNLQEGQATVPLVRTDNHLFADTWTADGRFIVFTEEVVAPVATAGDTTSVASEDLWVFPYAAGGEPLPLLTTPYDESSATVSPDGKWFAYHSNESGEWDIYVRPFPADLGAHDASGQGPKWKISSCGGWPVWSADGGEIYYLDCHYPGDRTLWAVPVGPAADGAGLAFGDPEPLFSGPFNATRGGYSYSVLPDGRFLMVEETRPLIPRLHVVVNFAAELAKLLPASR